MKEITVSEIAENIKILMKSLDKYQFDNGEAFAPDVPDIIADAFNKVDREIDSLRNKARILMYHINKSKDQK